MRRWTSGARTSGDALCESESIAGKKFGLDVNEGLLGKVVCDGLQIHKRPDKNGRVVRAQNVNDVFVNGGCLCSVGGFLVGEDPADDKENAHCFVVIVLVPELIVERLVESRMFGESCLTSWLRILAKRKTACWRYSTFQSDWRSGGIIPMVVALSHAKKLRSGY